MRVTWLEDVLRSEALVVADLDGWQGRGVPLTRVDAVICHATITPKHVPDQNVAGILRNGRPDLHGPLAQLGLDRSGRWWLVADGRCNHNGYGKWGNQSIGIEAFNDGTEPWPTIQLDSWQRGVAAICRHLDLPVDRVLGHKESDPRRKQDPKGVDMVAFRRRVSALKDNVHAAAEEPEMTDAERAQLVAEIVDAVEARLSDTKRVPGNRMHRAVNASERIAKHFDVPLSDG